MWVFGRRKLEVHKKFFTPPTPSLTRPWWNPTIAPVMLGTSDVQYNMLIKLDHLSRKGMEGARMPPKSYMAGLIRSPFIMRVLHVSRLVMLHVNCTIHACNIYETCLVQWVHKFYFYFLSPVPHHLLWNTYYNNFGSWKWHEINGAIVGEVHFTWMKQHVPRVNYIVQQSTWSPCLPCRPILSTLF